MRGKTMFWKKSKWSKNPGCFERHLQRRDGNILFPEERRIVSKKEIKQAQQQDKECLDIYIREIAEFVTRFYKDENADSQLLDYLKETQSLIEEGASMDISNEVLNKLEDSFIAGLNEAMPEGRHLLEKASNLSMIDRLPYFAQIKREDSPILKTEELPTILSEDLETITFIGYMSRSFPEFRPSGDDVKKFLDEAISQGFDKKEADKIISAWNEKQ